MGHAVADRYVNSVIANHAAVHCLDNDTVAATITPFANYLVDPDLTVYLRTDVDVISDRLRARPDQTQSDRDLLSERALLERLQSHYDQVASNDSMAYLLHPGDRTAPQLVDEIVALVRALAG